MDKVYAVTVYPKCAPHPGGYQKVFFSKMPSRKKALAAFRASRRMAYECGRKYGMKCPTASDKRFDKAVDRILSTMEIPKIPESGDVVRIYEAKKQGRISIEVDKVW